MTREEAIIYLKQADVTVGRDIKTKTAEALEMAIKALEQEPTNSVLKNIKAEISNELVRMYMYRNYANGLGKAIELIDKYMTEK